MQAQQLPHNDYAEQIAIGCLLEGYDVATILAELVAEDFYSAANRVIFATARDLAAEDVPVGHFTVTDRLRKDGNLDKVGGEGYLERCAGQVVSITQAEGAVWGVRDAALLRHSYIATTNAAREFTSPAGNAPEIIGQLQTKLLDITARNKEVQAVPVKQTMMEAVEAVERYARRSGPTGLATGYRLLDYWTGGLQDGELIILAARPSMGKTSLMMGMAQHAAMAGKRVYVCSLEMTRLQLALRMMCSHAMVDSHRVRTGRADESEMHRLVKAADELSHANLMINDSTTELMELLAAVKREAHYQRIDMLAIDYLQLIGTRFARGESRDREVGMITKQLKALAKELNVPVLCLSQLSRVNENQKVKEPTLNALRDSGNIEQDADTVCFIHSPDYYNREADGGGQLTEWRSDVIIAKQRNGPTETVPMLFRRQFTRFFDVDQRQTAPAVKAGPDWYNN